MHVLLRDGAVLGASAGYAGPYYLSLRLRDVQAWAVPARMNMCDGVAPPPSGVGGAAVAAAARADAAMWTLCNERSAADGCWKEIGLPTWRPLWGGSWLAWATGGSVGKLCDFVLGHAVLCCRWLRQLSRCISYMSDFRKGCVEPVCIWFGLLAQFCPGALFCGVRLFVCLHC